MSCHGFNPTQPTFSDNKFHNIGVSAHKQNFVELARKGLKLVDSANAEAIDRAALETDMSELGRFLVTKQPKDIGAFKTPGLRNLLVTAALLPRRLAGDAVGHRSTTTTRAASRTRSSTAASRASG